MAKFLLSDCFDALSFVLKTGSFRADCFDSLSFALKAEFCQHFLL